MRLQVFLPLAHRFLAVALLATVVLAQGTGQAPRPTLLARHGEGALYRVLDQRLLLLRGNPYEMGVQHGRLLEKEVASVVRETLAWTKRQGCDRACLTAIRNAGAAHLPKRYQDELRGLAEGARIPLEDLSLLHAMPERFHCSGAAVARSATRDGQLYHTRSLDYALDIGDEGRLQNHALLIVRLPTDGIPHAVPSWAGFIGAVTGMNAAGITVGEMGSESNDESFAGLHMIFLLREVLTRATTLQGAIDLFERGPRTCGYNYIVGSGDERLAACIEVTRNQFFVARMNDEAESVPPHTRLVDAVRRTNHFVGEATAATQREVYDPRRSKRSSFASYEAITQFLTERHGRLDGPQMVELLRRYPPGHPCLHQAVMGGGDRILFLSQAGDDRELPFPGAQNRDFYRYELRPLFAGRVDLPVQVLTADGSSLQVQPPTPQILRLGTDADLALFDTSEIQRSPRFLVERIAPRDKTLPTLELYRPREGPASGTKVMILFTSGDPLLRFDRAMAALLAARGIACLLIPMLRSEVLDLERARELIRRPSMLDDLLKAAGLPGADVVAGAGVGGFLARRFAGNRALVLLFHGNDNGEAMWTSGRSVALFGLPADTLSAASATMERWSQEPGQEPGSDTTPARVLFFGVRGESMLPEQAQEEVAGSYPAASVRWLPGGISTLPLLAGELASAIERLVRDR